MLKPILAANWKMNHGPTDARAFMRNFLAHYRRDNDRTVAFFPPSITLAAVQQALADRHEFVLGVQNIHHEASGAFTGEISAGMARDAGARLVLVGHSERRHVFGETDEQTALKCELVCKAGLVPMLCVGEKLEEREAGQTEQVVLRQLDAGISRLEPTNVATMLIAYEPVWAIGTGRTATPQDASAVHAAIRRHLRERIGERAAVLPILYGGSVNRGNARLLLAAPDVDGLLVGGASLDAGNWAAICQE
ncbi:Triosephosphate isomerase, bacterial/eukaryotic [Gemmatirosa kalamazoonensis]|uniref:Triosephosphate isomerase n=1 Tax=Gemmatirosa kalamazoonensis TaxID=861299 RepID=W0RKJ8_9BACT|nr:triose-phosphate isomerase [Gemmatirosa kalamazoonensis]AHG90845.1 Triosephosphate isomerase, bacterial/eukaryotic [Gemmatirosa kalamazoonensis]